MPSKNVIKLTAGNKEANNSLDVKTILTEFFESVDTLSLSTTSDLTQERLSQKR